MLRAPSFESSPRVRAVAPTPPRSDHHLGLAPLPLRAGPFVEALEVRRQQLAQVLLEGREVRIELAPQRLVDRVGAGADVGRRRLEALQLREGRGVGRRQADEAEGRAQ